MNAPTEASRPREPSYPEVLSELARHPSERDLAKLVHMLAFTAFDERRTSLAQGAGEAAERLGLRPSDAETPHGNVLTLLEQGAAGASVEARMLLGALLARGVALSPPDGAEAELRVAEALAWLARETSIDALSALEHTMGDKSDGLLQALGALVRKADRGAAPALGRAGAMLAAVALRGSERPLARAEAELLRAEIHDPVVRALLGGEAGPRRTSGTLAGELMPTPRGPVLTALLAATGVLALMRVGRVMASLVLRYRCPAEITTHESGVRVRYKTELLGRTLRERELHFPREALSRVEREVRYPRAALYAGLFALALGSYVGTRLFAFGAQSSSPELLGLGALVVALGLLVDYALSYAAQSARGRARLVLVPRKGAGVAVAGPSADAIDRALFVLLP